MKRPRRNLVVAAVLCSLLALPACVFFEEEEEGTELSEMTASVAAFDFYFETETVILEPEVEATIEFTNNGSNLHSFSVPDLDVEVEAEPAETATVTFVTPDVPGPYEFFCKYHPDDMAGAITIGADQGVPDDTETEIEVDE